MTDQPVVIITGAGSGIGRAVAEALGAHGYRLALLSRTADQLQETRRRVGHGLVLATDIRSASAVRQAVDQAHQHFGQIDALVNVAGFLSVTPVSTMDLEQWQATLETNLSGAFYLCQAVWRYFQAQNHGVIVNISSPAARDPFPGLGAYGAAKAGVETLGLVLAREGSPHGIRVHTLSPGATETQMFRRIFSTEQVPSDQTLAPQDVAAVVVQCVNGELSHTSGTVIHLKKQP